jgi:hypothetical protein
VALPVGRWRRPCVSIFVRPLRLALVWRRWLVRAFSPTQFMDMDELPKAIVMDRDRIFLPLVRQTLPAMGIRTIRIGYQCPWQNAVVERLHRTLDDELLRYVQPLNEWHLKALLAAFRHWRPSALPAEAVVRRKTALPRRFVPPLPPEIIRTGWIHP